MADVADLEYFLDGFAIRAETISKIKEMGFTGKTFMSNVDELLTLLDSIKQHCHLTLGEEWGIKGAAKKWQKEGEPPPKKTRRSAEEYLSSDAGDTAESKDARTSYYGKLLEAPPELPKSTGDIQRFLSATTEKLPLITETHSRMVQTELVKPCTSAAELPLACFLYNAYSTMGEFLRNEATSSHNLCILTGDFLKHLNEHAPVSKHLGDLFDVLESANPGTSKSTTAALLPRLRPDYQLFVGGVLMLRWENKSGRDGLLEAMEENKNKLKVWCPLYYGKLPYVIGGCCGGKTFRWLKLFPDGAQIAAEFVSGSYNLSTPLGLTQFLHSVIRMHCLLKRLEVELGDHIPVSLYVLKPPLKEGELRMLRSRVPGTLSS